MMLTFAGWRSVAAAMATGFLALFPLSASGQETAYVTLNDVDRESIDDAFMVSVRALNFRSDASLNNEPLSVVQQGDYLLKVGEAFNKNEGITWLNVVRKDGREGWVSGRHVQPIRDALATVEGAAAFLAALNPKAPMTVAALDDVRAGFIYPAPVGDAGWAFSHDAGRQALEQLSYVSNTSFIDSVPEDPDLVTAALEQLVADGSNLIFGASYGYMDPMMEAAKRHPDVVFMHNSGFKTQPNAGTYFGRIYQARYLSGIIAGAMTETNVVGYIAAFPIPEVIRGINAFTLGAQSVNPEIQIKVDWSNTWYGPGIEREKALGLLDQNADVLAIHQDSPAAVQAAAQRGKFAIGYHSDMAAFGPSAVLTSAVWDWSKVYTSIAEELRAGSWQPEQIWWGLDKGVVGLAPISDKVPQDVRTLVATRQAEIAENRLRVFEGPIRDADGEIRVPSGKILSDADLLTMDYYVLGVEGGVAPRTSTVSDNDEAS